jgi:hypothetical protein
MMVKMILIMKHECKRADICGRSVGKLGGKEMILIQCGEDERTIHTHIRAIKSHPSNTV